MAPLRLGIVGAGWGANHARVATSLAPLIQVTALCSRRAERVRSLGDELGLPVSALEQDWQALVRRQDVDLVAITAPDYLHHPIAMAAIAAGKHVFCEKPLAMDGRQALDMLTAAERAGVAHFTGFTWRFAPPFATLRRLLDASALGSVVYVDGHFRIGPPQPGKEWQFDPTLRAGGVLGNLGVHLIDLALYLAAAPPHDPPPHNGEPIRVWCRAEAWSHNATMEARPDVNDVVWLQIESGRARSRLQASQRLDLRAAEPVRVEVHGETATAVAYANPLFPERQRLGIVRRTSDQPDWVTPLDHPGGPPAQPTAALPSGGLLRPTIRHLYEAHIAPRIAGKSGGASGTPTFRDGVNAQRIMDAALESAVTGTWLTTALL